MNFDGFRPHRMAQYVDSDGSNSFNIIRMVPPGKLNYFYSIGDIKDMKPEEIMSVKTFTDVANPV